MPVIRLVAPSPRVAKQPPGVGAETAIHIGHKGGTLLVPHGDEANLVATGKGLHDIEIFFTGYPEDVRTAWTAPDA